MLWTKSFKSCFKFMFLTCEFHPIIGKKCLLKCGKLSMMVENKNFQLIFDDITTIRDFSKSQILKRFHHYNLWMSSNYWSDFSLNMKRSFMAEHNFLQSLVQWGISLHLLWLMWEQNWIRGWFPLLTPTDPSCMLSPKWISGISSSQFVLLGNTVVPGLVGVIMP